ncbi:MAG: PAS domain S-box protein [Acidobacteriota bacterium]|nr:PAS domain S-box protein [Acidobacteriota bacterium]
MPVAGSVAPPAGAGRAGGADGVAPTSGRRDLSDEDLSVFLDLATDVYGIFDPQKGLVWANPSVVGVLGYEPEEIRHVDLADLVHPEDLGAPTEDLEDFPRDGSLRTLEVRCRAKDGGWRWLELTGSWEAPTGVLYGAARDVTDRRLTQAALARNERLMQAILDQSTAAVYVEDLDERYLLVNDAFLAIVGRGREEVVGRRAAEVWAPRPNPGGDVDALVMASGESVTRDDVVDVGGGPRTYMTVRFPVRDAAGATVGMAGIATDITGRTEAEEALAERERLLDTIVRACPDIVTILDSTGRVREVSQASSRILGYDLRDPVHEELEGLLHPDDLAAIYRAYARLLTQETPQIDLRYRVRHRDGHWVTLDTRGQVVRGDDGRAEGAVVVSRDITADLAFQTELEEALRSAEEASAEKSDFLSRMSHELRTPLNSVMGFAQLLGMDALGEEQTQAVGHILRAGHHLLNLIDEVLDIARIESGRLDLSLGPVPVAAVVADALDLAGPLAEDRHIALVVDLGAIPATTHVRADRQRLMQVMLNLLSNGVKYNDPEGRVTVSARLEGGAVTLAVADTGPGIDPHDAERVFRPFDRLGAERTAVQGTGVGLTLSKHLVEQMGGSIALASEPGRGATFTVTLPVTDPEVQTQAPRRSRSGSRRGEGVLRVLHIEDNLANLELVDQVLSRSGTVDLRAAMFGGLGLELAREERPDLVLLDLHLPDMPGADVLERLRQDPATATVPVVVVSADATPEQVRGLRDKGVLAYLTKPIDLQELLAVVDRVGKGSGS